MSNRNESKVNVNGISFAGLLAIVFIVLKLCGVITWSWVWVLSPIWIGWGFAALVIIGVVIGVKRAEKKRRAFYDKLP